MIYVSSDWHGVPLAKIKELLKSANFSDDDFLFVLGDVIDRGEYGVELLKWMMLQPNVELILGNHEALLLSCDFLLDEVTEESIDALNKEKLSLLSTWQFNDGDVTIKALAKESPETRTDIVDYIREAPYYDSVRVNGRDYLLVHGGLANYSEGKEIDDYTPDELIWARPDYNENYSADFITVVGHTPTIRYGLQNKGRIFKTNTWWDIDTGGVSGSMPMLLCLDNEKEYYLEGEF